ncbi:MAG: glgC 3 [Acidobacteria bacterium]|nr:glgC 3 [Acidobacteriota bacterium]
MPLPPCLVLTAGLGTRLRPLTWLRAKPALPVAGVPLVNRILRWLAAAGTERAALNLHHLPETIRAAVAEAGLPGLDVLYSYEDPILGSAGGPKKALPLLGARRVLVVNGDTLTDVDLRALAAEHAASRALVTMAVVPNREPGRYGGVLVGDDGLVSGFVRRGSPGPSWHFVGVQLLEAEALEGVPDGRPSESVADLYPRLIGQRPGSVRAFRCDASFRDIGTVGDYLRTSLALAAGDARLLAGARCTVAPGASIARSILWEDVTVGPGAELRDCVATDGVSVPAGSRFEGQVLVSGQRARAVPAGTGRMTGEGLLVVPVA